MNKEIVEKLKQLSTKSLKYGDIPVGCIILQNNKIISTSYNNKYKKNNPIGHAEVNAIIKACKKLKRVNLMDCTLYTTLYPCNMCKALIEEVRIKKVNYILDNTKTINSSVKYEQVFDNEKGLFLKQIKEFFANKR